MARETHAREDLLRDAVALTPRATFRLRLGDREITLFAGFRGQALSLYFGDDPVYHFNSRGELRRAYVDDCLIKADRSRLVELRRRRTAHEAGLDRREINTAEEVDYMQTIYERLNALTRAIDSGAYHIIGQEPPNSNLLERLQRWLAANTHPAIAVSPRVG